MDFDFYDDALDTSRSVLPNSPHVVFDIETGPAWHPGESIEAARAYCRPLGIDYDPDSIGEHPGEFNADAVKVGNLKDPAKIEAKIEAARQSHEIMVAGFEKKRDEGESAFWQQFIDNAPLSPVTGRVLAIGFSRRGDVSIGCLEERSVIQDFWNASAVAKDNAEKLIGWNIAGFDVPFLVWRSASLGVEIPRGVYRGKWLSDTFVDLMDRWPRLYNPWHQKGSTLSAKHAAAFLGCSRPDDEIEGKDFWRYWHGSQEERVLAIRYLENDVQEETIIAKRLGVI